MKDYAQLVLKKYLEAKINREEPQSEANKVSLSILSPNLSVFHLHMIGLIWISSLPKQCQKKWKFLLKTIVKNSFSGFLIDETPPRASFLSQFTTVVTFGIGISFCFCLQLWNEAYIFTIFFLIKNNNRQKQLKIAKMDSFLLIC